MGEVVERFFNVFDPPLIAIDWIEADVPATSLYLPRIRHQATLSSTLTIVLDNPFSLYQLLVFSELFPLLFIGSKLWRIPVRTSLFPACPHTLARGKSWSGTCSSWAR